MHDYVPEDRPNQEDLWFDEDGDRLLWQLQLNRAQAAQAWATWLRESYTRRLRDVDGPVVRIPGPRVSYLPRQWEETDTGSSEATQGGDS